MADVIIRSDDDKGAKKDAASARFYSSRGSVPSLQSM